MIHNTQSIQNALLHPSQAQAARSHLHKGARGVTRNSVISTAAQPEAATGTGSTQSPGAAQQLITNDQQAVEATQHARTLIQAQAQAALLAQANASSQSVERLLS